MRVVFLSIVLSALALNFDAHALTTGEVYKHCNKYAERSFEYSEPTDAVCISYFAGIRDSGASICKGWKIVLENTQSIERKIQIERFRSMEGVGDIESYHPAIQHFVNRMQNEPENWKYSGDFGVKESLQKIAPCE